MILVTKIATIVRSTRHHPDQLLDCEILWQKIRDQRYIPWDIQSCCGLRCVINSQRIHATLFMVFISYWGDHMIVAVPVAIKLYDDEQCIDSIRKEKQITNRLCRSAQNTHFHKQHKQTREYKFISYSLIACVPKWNESYHQIKYRKYLGLLIKTTHVFEYR